MSEERSRKLKELLQTLLERELIVPSSSPIAAPVFFVEKKGTEDLFLVMDYRELNKITIKNDYPMPRLQDLIDRLGKAQWFSKLDSTSGYYQVQVAEPDQWKTTFRTRYGTFQFKLPHLKVQYLGFAIEPGGVGPGPEKVGEVQKWPVELLDRKQLRGFLGLLRYYRRLVPNFDKWAHPLHELLREESGMTWWPKHTEAVQRLKDALAAVTLLKIYDPDKELTINSDASKHAIGAVLEQEGHPIAFESNKLGPRGQFTPSYESELLAIIYALMKRQQLIGTKKLRIETDHATLGRILTQKNVTPRLGYWLDKLPDFDMEEVYKPGKQNVVAEALSRRSNFMGVISKGTGCGVKLTTEEARWAEEYSKCDTFQKIVKLCKVDRKDKEEGKEVVYEGKRYMWEHRYLWALTKGGWEVCVPGSELKREVCGHVHDHMLSRHPGFERTRAAIRQIFWWPKMDYEIDLFAKSCVQRAKGKSSHSRPGGSMQPLPIPNMPRKEIAMDLIVGLPRTKEGWDAILTIVCKLTKMSHFVPSKHSASAEDIAILLVRQVIRFHGVPSAIVSDRDTRFTSEVWRVMRKRLAIEQKMSTAYHPQTGGQAERTNQTFRADVTMIYLG
ncbi:retrotransposon ty3-gypsy subclass [Cystoisospora suis]|uniref:Retrotransposon ty3-gypsy subclass n=1 Tax=Cystoisospora suis TaxID=483139 RepID=A0A2C6KWG2_9APIC|nr:retrotransposon ty3-gypsy subclass [Cystoisospora suis]